MLRGAYIKWTNNKRSHKRINFLEQKKKKKRINFFIWYDKTEKPH